LGVPVTLFYYIYREALKNKGKILTNELGKKNIIIEQSLGAIKETKILNRENYFINIFKKINAKIEKISFFSYIISVSPRLFLEVSALLAVASVAVFLTLLERPSSTIIPMISLLAVSAIRFIPGLNLITSSLGKIRFLQEPFNLILDVVKKLNLSNKQNLNNNFESKRGENKKFNNNIKLKNVSYNYESSKKMTLQNVNIEISKGTSVGIIGRSGAGKSTLIDIILGLLKPKSGQIIIDGENMDKKKTIWQTQIGYVPQNIYLLDDTIKNNIIFGINEEDIDEILLAKVIEMAQLKNLINTLPDNIHSIVGNRGAKLSGGEKQRIGIARALYKKPEILILDEPTSSLDFNTEQKFLSSLKNLKSKLTIVFISHKKQNFQNTDRVIKIRQGKIYED
jgi:ATP-binding cassette subfamily C protein